MSDYWELFFTDFGGNVEALRQADESAADAIVTAISEPLELVGKADQDLLDKAFVATAGDFTLAE